MSKPSRPFGYRYDPAGLPHPLPARAGRAATRMILRAYFRTEHVDRHHIPRQGGAILVANHPTMGDPFFVAFGTRRWVSWLAFDEALEWPGAGQVMRLYRAIPLNLDNPRPSSIKAAYATLARGRILGVFCEGERSFQVTMNNPIKRGAARMAIRAGVPVVPVTISGLRRVWPLEGFPKPGKVVVRYHPPIHPERLPQDLHRREQAEVMSEEITRRITAALPPCGAPYFRP